MRIEQDHQRMQLAGQRHGLFAIARGADVVLMRAEAIGKNSRDVGMFADHEDKTFALVACVGRGVTCCRDVRTQAVNAFDLLVIPGEGNGHGGSLAGRALDFDVTGKKIEQLLRDVESEAGTFV